MSDQITGLTRREQDQWYEKRIEELEARVKAHSDYSIDLARIIENLCHGDEIRTPTTSARFHYDMAVAYMATRDSMKSALSNLYATVKGECPSLLNEDSGGDARLDMACREALGMSPPAKVHPIARCMMDLHDKTVADLEAK